MREALPEREGKMIDKPVSVEKDYLEWLYNKIAALEAVNAELREELAAVLYVATNRGETLGYEDEDYRERMQELNEGEVDD